MIDEYTRHKYMELAMVATVNWLSNLEFDAPMQQKKSDYFFTDIK